jgi:hypothetical protein
MFLTEDQRLNHWGNVVEADKSRFKRHANVGRILRAVWFFGVLETLTAEQRRIMTPEQ